jgi:hypothetical protein
MPPHGNIASPDLHRISYTALWPLPRMMVIRGKSIFERVGIIARRLPTC